jgi:carboxypeptidase-like protein/putative zinc finger protein
MQHLDEGTIHAWLDGALAPNEASAAEAHVDTCEQCARAVAEARGLIAASSRILGALDEVPAVQGSTGALSLPLTRTRRRSWVRRGGLGYAVAATALLAVGTTLVWSRMSPDSTMDARVTAASEAPAPVAATSQIGDSVASKRAAESRPPAADLARDAVADPKNVTPTVTSAKLSEKKQQAQKEEDLAIDRVVPLPGAMPRPAAPTSTPPVRQQSDLKALGEAAANARPAQVLGRVLDAATGAPVAGAIVSMDTARVSARTDSAGKFQLQPVPLGNQTVSVRAMGYQQAQHPVAVAASDTVQLAFALQKSALALQQVVVTGTAASAQQDRRDAQGAPREAERSKAVGQEGARLSRPSSRAESVAGCYTLSRVAQDKARDEDRALAASLPSRVQLESELVDRSRANELSANRARTLTGTTRAESWRLVGDSLEVTLVDGDRRTALRFARRDTRWVSTVATLEPCSGQ